MNRAQTVDALGQDLRYGLRTLARQKGWTSIALLTMSLGIGASTAMFSAVNSLILNPLPYRDADRVAMIWRVTSKSSIMMTPSKPMLDVWKAQTRVFDDIEDYSTDDMTLTGRGDAVDVVAGLVRASFPAFAGVPLLRGRTFLPEETAPGGPRVVILGEGLWRERFGGLSTALGQRITLNDQQYTVVGVAPSRLQLPELGSQTSVWLPLADSLDYAGTAMARVRRGLSFDAAAKELNDVAVRNHLDFTNGEFETRLRRPSDDVDFKTSLYLLCGAVALLLLVACANVAHLLLARAATRERELAIRAALGAGRWRLARQLLTESGILAAIGCVGGIALGYAGVRALAVLRPDSLNELSRTHVDGRVLFAAIAMSAVAGVAFGCTAALHAIRRTTSDSLRTSASSSAASHTHRLRSILVVSEMALSALLLVGAMLLVRTVIKLQHVDSGFNPKGLYTLWLELPRDRFTSSAARTAFANHALDEARQISGVTAAARSRVTPPGAGGAKFEPIEVEDGATEPSARWTPANTVAPNYFQVLGIRLEGATFGSAPADSDDIIVNRSFASKYWPGQPAVGRRFRFKGKNQKPGEAWKRVVGVADNVPLHLGSSGADRSPPAFYERLNSDDAGASSAIVVRVRPGVDPTEALRRIVTSLDSRLPRPSVTGVEDDLARTFATQRFTMTLLTVFATLAVVLSAIGLYGVISYVVTQRTREIGIRVALGAMPLHVARTIVVRGLALAALGVVIGLVASIWGTSLIKASLFGITSTDAASYVLASVLLLGVSLFACAVPMRRAMRVDPAIAMRGD
jgi:putative ABC transport system permease protein